MTTFLIDTSVWLDVLRDKTGDAGRRLETIVGVNSVVNAPFIITELLQGASDDREWAAIKSEISKLPLLPLPPSLWEDAARMYFDLRRASITPRSTVDCYLAQLCLSHGCVLIHRDKDFDAIASVRPLQHIRL